MILKTQPLGMRSNSRSWGASSLMSLAHVAANYWAADLYPLLHRSTRRALTRRFPFGIYYLLQTNRIVVVAVLHGNQTPLTDRHLPQALAYGQTSELIQKGCSRSHHRRIRSTGARLSCLPRPISPSTFLGRHDIHGCIFTRAGRARNTTQSNLRPNMELLCTG